MKKNLRQLIIMLCLMAAPLGVKAQSIVFHLADGDRTITLPATFTVTPADDLLLIGIGNGQNLTLSKDDVQYVTYRDADGSQRVDVADVATIVSLLIGSAQSSGTAPANVEAVDLGLPSGTLWANMNIGATKPEDYGDYFAWGETETKDEYSRNTYGYTSNEAEFDLEDDAAYVNWGSDWRMPTREQFVELLNNTTTEWTNQNGVFGRKLTSKINGKSIFLPAAGCRSDGSLSELSSTGYYWSRSHNPSTQSFSTSLRINSTVCNAYEQYRYFGLSVRPVRSVQAQQEESVEAVDLGLPSGTKWANMNVGASSPEDYGDYFAWGETETKNEYGVSTYKWCNGSYTTMTKYCSRSEYGYNGFTDNKTQLDPEDDAAYVNLGSDWRMPTYANIQELLDNCTTEWTTINSVNGWRFTGPNGNSIFLPAGGCIKADGPSAVGMWGYYWSSTFSLNDENEGNAWILLGFPNSGADRTSAPRDIGRPVRPVRQD